jgi:hypothetical protein
VIDWGVLCGLWCHLVSKMDCPPIRGQ